MTEFVFPLARPSLAIACSAARFPVRRIWCVGRNYLDHVKELGNDTREPPFFFSKQPDMAVQGMAVPGDVTIPYPSLTNNYHFETELVVALKAGGTDVPVAEAGALIFGHAVGLDMTRRDLQKAASRKASPGKPARVPNRARRSVP